MNSKSLSYTYPVISCHLRIMQIGDCMEEIKSKHICCYCKISELFRHVRETVTEQITSIDFFKDANVQDVNACTDIYTAGVTKSSSFHNTYTTFWL